VVPQVNNSGVPPDKLSFEITETAAIVNMTKATHFIEALKDKDCGSRWVISVVGCRLSRTSRG
jgi:EAL domain-containing protein (putative c-di-GMP-specific phosphodiesterase class I)